MIKSQCIQFDLILLFETRIVWRVAGLFALACLLEQRLAQARRQVESGFDTSFGLRPPSPHSGRRREDLLARAFAGQLVPQNPADKSAEKLLERIKTC